MPRRKKIVGRGFGARYGKTVRQKYAKVEKKQRVKQDCPFCKKGSVKRVASGIWKCKKCEKKFASGAYYVNE